MADAWQLWHTHASGRFDRTPKDLLTQVWRLLPASDVLTLTEVTGTDRAEALRSMPGVESHIATGGGGGNDCAILWRRKHFVADHRYTVAVGTTFKRGKADAQVHVSTVVLRDPKDRKLAVTVCHAPAHIEGVGRLRGTVDRVRAYRTVMRDWKRHVKDVDEAWQPDAWIVSADWNLNFRRPWVRSYLRVLWAPLGLRPAWTRHTLPLKGGTHGSHRVIDGPLIPMRARVAGMRILPLSEASDHHAVRADLRVY